MKRKLINHANAKAGITGTDDNGASTLETPTKKRAAPRGRKRTAKETDDPDDEFTPPGAKRARAGPKKGPKKKVKKSPSPERELTSESENGSPTPEPATEETGQAPAENASVNAWAANIPVPSYTAAGFDNDAIDGEV